MAPALLSTLAMINVGFFRKSHLALTIVALGVAFAVSACGKGFKAVNPAETAEFTGAKDKNGVPYTAAGDSTELKALKSAIDSKVPANMALALKIDSVKVDRLDKSGTAVTTKPEQLEIQIVVRDMNPSPLVFRAIFPAPGSTALVKDLKLKTDSPGVSLTVRCFDEDCSASEMRLTTKTSDANAVAGFIHRKRTAQILALGPFDPQNKVSRLANLAKAAQTNPEAQIQTTEVAWGPSMFDFKAGNISASGGLTQTGTQEEVIALSLVGEKPFDAKLLGNNNRGDLLIRVNDEKSWSFLRVVLPKATQPSEGGDGDIVVTEDGPSADRLIDWDPNHPITKAFQRDLGHPEIQRLIIGAKARAAGEPGRIGRWLDLFVNRVRPSAPKMTEILKKRGLPAEMIFITMIESSYFKTDGFPISTSQVRNLARSQGARGPWQFMPNTAKSRGLKIADSKTGQCDERDNLEASTNAAADYFKDLFAKFPIDPKLAIMAYNAGQGSVVKALKCQEHANPKDCVGKPVTAAEYVQNLRSLQGSINFWDLLDLNIVGKESREYVIKFVTAQYLGREPVRNGFPYDGKTYPEAPVVCARK